MTDTQAEELRIAREALSTMLARHRALTTQRNRYHDALRKVARIEDGLDHGPAVAREALRGGGES